MADVSYNIIRTYGIIGHNKSGWSKELNLVSWNQCTPKIDIRAWEPNKTKMGKGLTFTKAEAFELFRLLSSVDFSDLGTQKAETAADISQTVSAAGSMYLPENIPQIQVVAEN